MIEKLAEIWKSYEKYIKTIENLKKNRDFNKIGT